MFGFFGMGTGHSDEIVRIIRAQATTATGVVVPPSPLPTPMLRDITRPVVRYFAAARVRGRSAWDRRGLR